MTCFTELVAHFGPWKSGQSSEGGFVLNQNGRLKESSEGASLVNRETGDRESRVPSHVSRFEFRLHRTCRHEICGFVPGAQQVTP